MKNRYIYRPDKWADDGCVVREFVNVMKDLQTAHRCPVRLVKTKCLLGYHCAVYELCPETKE